MYLDIDLEILRPDGTAGGSVGTRAFTRAKTTEGRRKRAAAEIRRLFDSWIETTALFALEESTHFQIRVSVVELERNV